MYMCMSTVLQTFDITDSSPAKFAQFSLEFETGEGCRHLPEFDVTQTSRRQLSFYLGREGYSKHVLKCLAGLIS